MVAPLPGKPGGARDAAPKAAYSQAFKDVAAHVEADDAFCKVKGAVESHLGLLQKQAQVRLRNWLKKLSEETANLVWKKNRNAYARLLLEQLRRGTIAEPFSAAPPDGPLPTLPKHMAYAFKPPRASSPTATGGRTEAAGQRLSPVEHQPPPQPRQQEQQQQELSATEQLDKYLGRTHSQRAQFADERAEVEPPLAAHRQDDSSEGSVQYLPGTRMQLRGSEGRRVDKHQLSDMGWQPSKFELQAQLGASRERQAELEWRLQQMEGLLHQHSTLLQQGQKGQPLGSLLDALDNGDQSSPPRQRAGKEDLEEMIERFEAKRRQWQPSQKCQAVKPTMAPSDDAKIFEQLDNFQRQTESIRRALGGGGGDASGPSPFHLYPSSIDGATSGGSEWGVPAATPLQQRPTGLRSSGYTPRPQGADQTRPQQQQQHHSLFDGLPLSPAALASSHWPCHRHVEHAGHLDDSSMPPHAQQQQQKAAAGTGGAASSTSRPTVGAEQPQQLPRSPIGPDIRHTRKSAAAAERNSASASAALQRLKSARQPTVAAAGAAASTAASVSPSASSASQQQTLVPKQRQDRTHLAVQGEQQRSQEAHQPPEPQRQQQHQETVTQQQEAYAPALELPPDSNAALVAEVRQLRSKLMASLAKHTPELDAGAGVSTSKLRSGYLGGADSLALGPRKLLLQLHEEAVDSSWRLEAVQPVSPALSASLSQLEVGGAASRSAWAVPPGTALASSTRKYRLTDFGSSGAISGLASELSPALPLQSSTATPTSLCSGFGGNLARLSSLEVGSSLPLASELSMKSFERQTEALRRQLAGL